MKMLNTEEQLRFSVISTNNEKDCVTNLNLYQVRDYIGELLCESPLSFQPVLQEFWNEDENCLEIFMHSDNWEDDEIIQEYSHHIKKCETLGFAELDDASSTKNILEYLQVKILMTYPNWKQSVNESYFSYHIIIAHHNEPKYHVLKNPDGEGWVIGEYYTFTREYVPLEEGEEEKRLTFPTEIVAMNYVDQVLVDKHTDSADNERELLLRRNQDFVQIPMPNLSKMTIDQLRLRADIMEQTFADAFGEVEDDKDEDEDL